MADTKISKLIQKNFVYFLNFFAQVAENFCDELGHINLELVTPEQSSGWAGGGRSAKPESHEAEKPAR